MKILSDPINRILNSGLNEGLADIFSCAPLDLRFAQQKTLDPRITFTRASSGTYVDSQGVIRRATTNLFTFSEELDNAAWGTFNTSVTQNASTAPNGTLTAERLVENTSNSTHDLRRVGVSFTSGLNYVFSIYAKQDGRSLLLVSLPSAAFGVVAQARFDLAAGTSTIVTAGTGTSASIVNVGGDWFRCVFVAQATATASGTCFWNLQVSSASTTYTGNGTSGIYLWGAQLEQSSTVGEYVPTTSTINSAPRFDHNPTTGESLGLLVEEQRTNSIRNNTMVGAVAGTPGTLPTNWGAYTALTGITREIVGTGTESGIAYIDIRLSGTPSTAGTYAFYTETSSAAAALSGQTWTNSQYIKLQTGSLTGISNFRLYFQENNSSGGYLTEQNITVSNPTNSGLNAQRVSATRTLNQVSTAYVQSGFNLTLTGAAIDITLRIGMPQLEQGAFPTSVIPTTTAAVTRSADVASITGANFGVSRTNLVQQSADISNVYWVKTETTVTANAITAPDGTTTAGKLVESTNNSQHTLSSAVISWAGNTQYTATFFAKAGERFKFEILLGTGANWVNTERVAQFDLATGTISLLPGSPAAASITPLPNNWYRCRVTATTVAAPSASAVFIRMCDDTGLSSYTGISGRGLYLWGAQVETGSTATAYIPTTTAAVTVFESSWYRQDEGTVYWEGNPSASNETGYFGVQDAGSTSFVRLSRSFNQARNVVSVSSVNQADLYSGNTVALGANNKFATAVKANDFALSLAGGTVVTDNSGTMPTVDRATIGTGAFLTQLNGTIRRLTYWPQRLPNTTLQQITQ